MKKKDRVALTDESGSIKIVNPQNGNIIKKLEGQNLDNAYQIDYKSHIIAVASKDRRCGVYKDDGTMAYYKSSNFIVYSVGISKDGKFCGYASDDKNDITIFNVSTKENLYLLKGNKSPISNIIFLNNENIVSSNRNKIKFWSLK